MTPKIFSNYFIKSFYIFRVFNFYCLLITDDMADIPTRQYNLRSGKQDEVHLPVQIQMAEDSTFLKPSRNL